MPFDYEEYQQKCDSLTTEQLQKEWENYTRQLAGGATSTATSVLFSPFTAGISLLGLGLSAPRIQNARKKREIIEAGLQERGATHQTRKRDVIAPMAIAGTLGTVTLGLAGPGAEIITGVAGHGVEYAVSHAALDSAGAILESKHDEHHKKKANEKLQAQYQSFQQQYTQEQATGRLPDKEPNSQKPGSISQDSNSALKPEVIAQTLAAISLDGSRPAPPFPNQSLSQVGRAPRDQKYEYFPVADSNKVHSQSDQNDNSPPPPAYTPSMVLPDSLQAGRVSKQTIVEKPVILENTIQSVDNPSGNEDDGPDMQSHYPAMCPSPFPLFSRPSVPEIPTIPLIKETRTTQIIEEQVTVAELPANEEVAYRHEADSTEIVLTMEQEIAFLKAKILQMEIEKRQLAAQGPTVRTQSPQKISKTTPSTQNNSTLGQQHHPPNLKLNTTSPSYSNESEDSTPPPPLPPRSPAPPSALQPQNPATQYGLPLSSYPPPPPSPRPAISSSGITPNSISQPLSYPPPPPPPAGFHQQHPALYNPSGPPVQQESQNYVHPVTPKPQHPPYNRQDSGYYSNPPTRHSSSFSSATFASYNPSLHSLSPQTTGNQLGQGYNASYNPAQFGPVSPMSPHPSPAYFTPPPSASNHTGVAAAVSGAKDYINNRLSQYLPDMKKYVPAVNPHPPVSIPAQSLNGGQGTQGWQWGVAAPPDGQPDYGPPPPIPQQWRN